VKKTSLKSWAVLLSMVVGIVFLNKLFLKDRFVVYPKYLMKFSANLFDKSESFRYFSQKIIRINSVADENERLKQENRIVLSLKAKIDGLEKENDFLRRAVRVSEKLDHQIIYGGIYNINLSPLGHNALVNKGIADNVSDGDIVITAEGILIGKIQKTMQSFSRILLISDTEFRVTAKTLDSGTSGILRGDFTEGAYLDFVVQADTIKEGDILVSTGNDMFPGGLILGVVDYVETNESQIFKKVKIHPSIKDVQLSKVLILKIK